MKRARVAYAGALHEATPFDERLRLADGRIVAEEDVVWLAPFEVGTVIAITFNYPDHAKEITREGFPAQHEPPLVFLKGPNTIIGHRGMTRRPRNVRFMHYECELAVVIGRTTRHVTREAAMDHVAGYTVCNDYAIRDYMENWHHPSMQAKSRDTCTVLGPWFVPVEDIADPHDLRMWTKVNGVMTQQGHTSQMIHDIPRLIEYLSAFMTLRSGDVLLTGTPPGLKNVLPGDQVITEIERIGRLSNTIIREPSEVDFG